MAKFYYNDVLLPEIPADVLSEYPYCWIRLQSDGSKRLFAGKGSWYYRTGFEPYPIFCSTVPFNIYDCTDDSDEWTFFKSNDGAWGLAEGLIWASYDILKDSPTSTEVYFEGSVHVHSYNEAITTPATCTAVGVKTLTCECGDSYTEEIPTIEHSYDENDVCTVCGQQYVPKFYHYNNQFLPEIRENIRSKYSRLVIFSGGASGITLYCGTYNWDYYVQDNQFVCVNVDETYVIEDDKWVRGSDITTVVRLNSDSYTPVWANHDVKTAGSSTVSGNLVLSASEPVLECDYRLIQTVGASCTTPGKAYYQCSMCGQTYSEKIPATGHTYVNNVCSICGAVAEFTSDEIISDADVNIEGVPDVPADILANYPYAVILEVTVNSNRYYVLVASVSEFYYVPKGVLMSSEIIGTLGNARVYTVKNGSWSQEAEYEAGTAYATVGNLGENTTADLVWSNHDIYIVDRANTSTGEYELGRVYFQNSEYTGDNGDFTVTHYYYNGVLLPEIPADVLSEYPYCWIRENTQTGYYDLFLAKTPWYQSDASTISTDSYTQGIQWYRVPFTGTSGEWQSYQVWDSSSGLTSETGRKIIWANHNIPVGSATSTDIYFAGSSAIPNAESYEIQRETIVALADQVRRLYNSTAPLTPAQMEEKLANLNIELQEAHVSVSEEEQIIRPDVGYYGFSSITVEAFEMDDSGGSIGGGSEGVETPDTELPDAEDDLFGQVYLTGMYSYGGFILPPPPDSNQYIVVVWDGLGSLSYTLYSASSPFVYNNDYFWTEDGSPCTKYTVNLLVGTVWNYYDTDNTGRGPSFPWDVHIIDATNYFTNHEIANDDTGVHYVSLEKTGDIVPTGDGVPIDAPVEPSYRVLGESMNRIATEVQKVVGATTPLSIDEMVNLLHRFATGGTPLE